MGSRQGTVIVFNPYHGTAMNPCTPFIPAKIYWFHGTIGTAINAGPANAQAALGYIGIILDNLSR